MITCLFHSTTKWISGWFWRRKNEERVRQKRKDAAKEISKFKEEYVDSAVLAYVKASVASESGSHSVVKTESVDSVIEPVATPSAQNVSPMVHQDQPPSNPPRSLEPYGTNNVGFSNALTSNLAVHKSMSSSDPRFKPYVYRPKPPPPPKPPVSIDTPSNYSHNSLSTQ